MAVTKSKEHATPAGGVRSTLTYLDDDGQPVDESVATQSVIDEYDRDGNSIMWTYGTINRDAPHDP